jgi:hypothetical protein
LESVKVREKQETFMEQPAYIIDKILSIEIDPDKYNNEFNALMQLKTGLLALYNNVRPFELQILEKTAGKRVLFFGESDLVPKEVDNLLPCFFHWFGNTLCNYARLTGYIAVREQGHVTDEDLQLEPERKKIKEACDNYVKTLPEISEVLKWRNKVSAHFALTDPRKDDNIATLEASIIYPVSFEFDRFRTGTMIFSKGDSEVTHDSEIPRWSLTEIFELLTNRFWPDITFNM